LRKTELALRPGSEATAPFLAFAPEEKILQSTPGPRIAKLLKYRYIESGTWIAVMSESNRLESMFGRCPVKAQTWNKEIAMLNWAVIFLIIAVVAAIFGFSGIAGAAVNIAWILAVIGIVLAIAFFVMGRRPPLP